MFGSKRRIAMRVAAAAVLAVGGVLVGQASSNAATNGSISGTVRAAGTGAPLAGVSVGLFETMTERVFGSKISGPGFVTSTTTASDGTYTLSGLSASNAGGYWVCFDTFGTALGNYADQCYLNQPGFAPFPDPFGFYQLPPGVTAIHLTGTTHMTGIDADMVDPSVDNNQTAGSVSGQVTQFLVGSALTGVRVYAMDTSSDIVGEALTNGSGTYVISGLYASARGYAICFDGSHARKGVSLRSYGRKCYQTVNWNGGGVPGNAKLVPVLAGTTTDDINVTLTPTP